MYKIFLVNTLTFIRLILSVLFSYYIIEYSNKVILITLLFLAICTTDFFDGRIARKLEANTKFGAIFDVIADLFFIIASYGSLIKCNIISPWILAVIIFKFLEFWITSSIIKKARNGKVVFVFDKIGRNVVILYYILPALSVLLMNYVKPEVYIPLIIIYGSIISAMTFISSFNRIKICINNNYMWSTFIAGVSNRKQL